MTNTLVLALAFGLLTVQGALHYLLERITGGQWFDPMLALPVVLYMAVGEFALARGASIAFVIGYLMDAFSGLPMGMFTFSTVAVFLLARVAGLKLFLHGVVFQMLLTFVAQMAAGALILGLHVVFERSHLAMGSALALVAAQSLATAFVSPLVFSVVDRVPGVHAARVEEG